MIIKPLDKLFKTEAVTFYYAYMSLSVDGTGPRIVLLWALQ